MGYTTDFTGEFQLNRPLDPVTREFLQKFADTRRMARNLGPEYGVEGEFYVDGGGHMGQGKEDSIIDYNRPPRTQPGLWCKWEPNEDGTAIRWNGAEKFYDYVTWLNYLISNFLAPKGYVLNGEVKYQGEDAGDFGIIYVKDNDVQKLEGKRTIPKPRKATAKARKPAPAKKDRTPKDPAKVTLQDVKELKQRVKRLEERLTSLEVGVARGNLGAP